MKASTRAVLVLVAVLLAATAGMLQNENGRRGLAPSRTTTSTGVNVDEKAGDGRKVGSGAAHFRAAAHTWWNDVNLRRREARAEREREMFAFTYKGSWPKLDPCPVHLREQYEGGVRMCLDTTPADARIPRGDIVSVDAEPAERAFLDLIGRPDTYGDADLAAAVRVIRFIVEASIMGTPADRTALRTLADELDSEESRRAKVLRYIVHWARSFAAGPSLPISAIKTCLERFPSTKPGEPSYATTRDMRRALRRDHALAEDTLLAMTRLLAVHELCNELQQVDARYGRLDPMFVYGVFEDVFRPQRKRGEKTQPPAVAAKLSVAVGAFNDETYDGSRKAFARARDAMKGRRCLV